MQVTNDHTEIDIKASKLLDDLDDVKVTGVGEGAYDSNISKLKKENNIKLEEDRLAAAAEVIIINIRLFYIDQPLDVLRIVLFVG